MKLKKLIILGSISLFVSNLFAGQIIVNKDLKISKDINKITIKRLFTGERNIDGNSIKRYIPKIGNELNKSFSKSFFNISERNVEIKLLEISMKIGIKKIKRLENTKRIFRNLKKDKYSIAVVEDDVKLPKYIKSIFKF